MTNDPITVARRTFAALGPTGWGGQPLADGDIDALLQAAPPVELAAGEVLAREGDPADRAYLLVAGRLRASVAVGGSEGDMDRTVNEIAAGEVTGESALFLTGGRRAATLTALEASTVLALTRELFLPGAPNPALVALESHILAGLARRIERTDAQIVEAWRAAAAGGGGPSRGGLLALLGGTS